MNQPMLRHARLAAVRFELVRLHGHVDDRRTVAEAQQAAQQALVGAPDGAEQSRAVRHAVVYTVLHLLADPNQGDGEFKVQ